MHDAALMGAFERISDLPRDRECFIDRDRTLRDPIRESRTLDELHDQEGTGLAFFDAMNVRDIRMVERGENLRFAPKARQSIDIRCDGGKKNLDRDVAIQFRITGPIHLAHAAHADERSNVVASEPTT
jgi:hypothetical protein